MSGLSPKSLFVNALTISRVPLIFLYLAFAVAGQFCNSFAYFTMAFVAGAAAGISDFFDGMLARRWGVVSDFGKMAEFIQIFTKQTQPKGAEEAAKNKA